MHLDRLIILDIFLASLWSLLIYEDSRPLELEQYSTIIPAMTPLIYHFFPATAYVNCSIFQSSSSFRRSHSPLPSSSCSSRHARPNPPRPSSAPHQHPRSSSSFFYDRWSSNTDSLSVASIASNSSMGSGKDVICLNLFLSSSRHFLLSAVNRQTDT